VLLSSDEISKDEWLDGCVLATIVAATVGLPALTIIIVILWLWEVAVKARRKA
jgi:hypothetical protein